MNMIRTAFCLYNLYIFFYYINLLKFYLHQLLSVHKLFAFYTLVQKQYDILHLHLLCDKLFTSFIDIEPPMLKCCGCQTNFILPLGGSFLSLRIFLPTPSLTGGFSHAYSAYKQEKGRAATRPFFVIL